VTISADLPPEQDGSNQTCSPRRTQDKRFSSFYLSFFQFSFFFFRRCLSSAFPFLVDLRGPSSLSYGSKAISGQHDARGCDCVFRGQLPSHRPGSLSPSAAVFHFSSLHVFSCKVQWCASIASAVERSYDSYLVSVSSFERLTNWNPLLQSDLRAQ
jgi:hypothetical protein